MATKQAMVWKRFLREHRDNYIKGTKGQGGYRKGWKAALHRDLLADSLRSDGKDAVIELALIAADEVWETTSKPPGDDQQEFLFTVGGNGVEDFYNFADANVPGGYRRVSGRYATPSHVWQSSEIKRIKAEQGLAAWKEEVAAHAAFLSACGNDPYATIWDFRDAKWPEDRPNDQLNA